MTHYQISLHAGKQWPSMITIKEEAKTPLSSSKK
jgi:hypothetical protein